MKREPTQDLFVAHRALIANEQSARQPHSSTSRRRGRRLWLSHHQSDLRQQRLDRVFAPRQGLARFVVGKVDAWRWLRPGVLILAAFDRIDENLNTLRTV
jgi:hypothetical protein